MKQRLFTLVLSASLVGIASAGSARLAQADTGGAANAQAGQDRPQIMMRIRGAAHHGGGGSNNLSYHGGTGGIGVETGADKVYLVYWGSQWNSNDPSGEAASRRLALRLAVSFRR